MCGRRGRKRNVPSWMRIPIFMMLAPSVGLEPDAIAPPNDCTTRAKRSVERKIQESEKKIVCLVSLSTYTLN